MTALHAAMLEMYRQGQSRSWSYQRTMRRLSVPCKAPPLCGWFGPPARPHQRNRRRRQWYATAAFTAVSTNILAINHSLPLNALNLPFCLVTPT